MSEREQFVRLKLEDPNLNDYDRQTFTAELEQIELSKQQQEAAIAEVTNDLTSGMEMFEVAGKQFTLYELAEDSDAVDILRSGIRTISEKQAKKFLEELSTQKSVYESQLNNKQELINSLLADRDELQSANAQLQLEKDDAEEKRDAAAAQLLELQAEVARLNSHVDDLRKDIATGSANAHNVIDITSDAELEAAARRLKEKQEKAAAEKKAAEEAARIKIYNVHQLDGTGSKLGANRADNNEYITFGWLEKGKYVELSNEEAARFQSELEATQTTVESAEEHSEDNTPLVEVPDLESFRPNEDDNTGRELDRDSTQAESVSNHDGGETFEQQVMRRLASLETAVYGENNIAA